MTTIPYKSNRTPLPLPNGDEWVGRRVWTLRQGVKTVGIVQRMAHGKELCCIVLFDGQMIGNLCYVKHLYFQKEEAKK